MWYMRALKWNSAYKWLLPARGAFSQDLKLPQSEFDVEVEEEQGRM